jgi:hypothetical protein
MFAIGCFLQSSDRAVDSRRLPVRVPLATESPASILDLTASEIDKSCQTHPSNEKVRYFLRLPGTVPDSRSVRVR